MTPLQQEVTRQLRAIATSEMDPHSNVANNALQVISSLQGGLASSMGAGERLRAEIANEQQRVKALENTVHNLDRRVAETWRLLNDAASVLLRAEAAIPVEQRDALDVIDAFLLRLKPPVAPAKETPK